ncbi:MAG: hypothetical protein CM1200mP15_19240 [Dehalococcoidia bacterium]|nr:MAG: hypothetical protein CM1200mP15_19240 [Dehalococcoidia bacterium]
MTKIHEEIFTGTIETANAFPVSAWGVCLVLQNEGTSSAVNAPADFENIKLELQSLRAQRVFRAKEAVAHVVLSTGLSRKIVYDLWLASRVTN